jgi:hypothetical protein
VTPTPACDDTGISWQVLLARCWVDLAPVDGRAAPRDDGSLLVEVVANVAARLPSSWSRYSRAAGHEIFVERLHEWQ